MGFRRVQVHVSQAPARVVVTNVLAAALALFVHYPPTVRLGLLILISACATTPKSAPRKTTCEVDVELVSAPYVGVATTSNDARKTLREARDAACAALRVDSPSTDCDDPAQVIETTRSLMPNRKALRAIHSRCVDRRAQLCARLAQTVSGVTRGASSAIRSTRERPDAPRRYASGSARHLLRAEGPPARGERITTPSPGCPCPDEGLRSDRRAATPPSKAHQAADHRRGSSRAADRAPL